MFQFSSVEIYFYSITEPFSIFNILEADSLLVKVAAIVFILSSKVWEF